MELTNKNLIITLIFEMSCPTVHYSVFLNQLLQCIYRLSCIKITDLDII